MKKPNLLFITSDQQRADCYGFEGRKVVTPHLDKLAASGTHFKSCITPNLVCQPSRASMLTGQLPLTHGVADNGIDLRPQVGERSFATALNGAGYQTAFLGKAHFSTSFTFDATGTPECRYSGDRYGPNWFGPYMGFEHVELTVLGHWFKEHGPNLPPAGKHYERWVFEQAGTPALFDEWARETRPGSGAAQTWHSALPPAFHNSTWCADSTVNYIRDRDPDKPFCAWVSFPDPHHPFDCPEPWSLLHHPDEVDMPVEGTKDLDIRPWWHRASHESTPDLADPQLLDFRAKLSRTPDQSEQQLREMTANYYGMISLIDHNVGRILAELDAQGLADDTIVIYSTDHGDLLGDHGLYLKGPTPYEALLRVGMIARGPGIEAGAVVTDPVSTLDVPATFCDYGGAELDEEAQSESIRPLLEGQSGASRDVAYSEWNVNASRCGVALALRTVRTETSKLTVELNSGAGELYNLKNDPHEMDNLFREGDASPMQRELEDMIKERPGKIQTTFDEPVGMA